MFFDLSFSQGLREGALFTLLSLIASKAYMVLDISDPIISMFFGFFTNTGRPLYYMYGSRYTVKEKNKAIRT